MTLSQCNQIPVSRKEFIKELKKAGIKEGNYNSMKDFGEKNHGKVFHEVDGYISLWEPIADFVIKEYKGSTNVQVD